MVAGPVAGGCEILICYRCRCRGAGGGQCRVCRGNRCCLSTLSPLSAGPVRGYSQRGSALYHQSLLSVDGAM